MLHHVRPGDRPSASQWNLMVDLLKRRVTGDGVYEDATGWHIRPTATTPAAADDTNGQWFIFAKAVALSTTTDTLLLHLRPDPDTSAYRINNLVCGGGTVTQIVGYHESGGTVSVLSAGSVTFSVLGGSGGSSPTAQITNAIKSAKGTGGTYVIDSLGEMTVQAACVAATTPGSPSWLVAAVYIEFA